MERLSTQIDFDSLLLEDAAKVEKECFEIQNKGTEDKQRAGRRAGILLNELEDKKGPKAKKEILPALQVSGATAKKWQKDAEIPEKDYERYVEETRKRAKELTNSGLRRAGKENKKSKKLLSAAGRVIQKLSPWVDSLLLRSLGKDYSGNEEDLKEAANLLEILAAQFAASAKIIRGKLTL